MRASAQLKSAKSLNDPLPPQELLQRVFIPFIDSGTVMRLPESLWLAVDISRCFTSGNIIELSELKRHPLSLSTGDMAPYDRFIQGALSADRIKRERSRLRLSRRQFNDFYRLAFDIPPYDSHFIKPVFFLHLNNIPPSQSGPKPPYPAFSVFFVSDTSVQRYRFFPTHFAKIIAQPQKMFGPYSYARWMRPHVDTAVGILAKHHPALHKENLQLLLLYHIISHQNELTEEDPFQDCAAASWAGSVHQRRMNYAYSRYESYRIGFGPLRIRVPLFAWAIATLAIPRYALKRQGLGPYQIIFGYAERAAQFPQLRQRYAPSLVENDFQTSKALVRALLDPVKGLYITAMVYDYILTTLEKWPLSNIGLRMPVDIAPYISNDSTAREYALLLLTQRLSLFPELAATVPALLTYKNHPLYAHLLAMGDIFGIEPHLPGLFYLKWTLPDRRIYSTYWVENADIHVTGKP